MSHYAPNTRIPTLVFDSPDQASRHAAGVIAGLVRKNNRADRPTVLGLATGATPQLLYRELIRLHQDEELDFSRVVTFNLDEYFPIPHGDRNSYHRYMREALFDHINLDPANVHIPDGEIDPSGVEQACLDYERAIHDAGGIDLQILGIGRTGHIGFNEPPAGPHSRTRLVRLDPVTIRDAADAFGGEASVPRTAVTMGVGTILAARRVLLLAFGSRKAPIVRRSLEDDATDLVTASHLQRHGDAEFLLDRAAAAELESVRCPWVVGPVHWDDGLARHATVWLSLTAGKPLTALTDDDFRAHHLDELLEERGPAEALTGRVFAGRAATITDGPPADPPQSVLIFSPHPDDDVISMGGTMIRLVEQGHAVHAAYMTSGNVAVFDHEALRFLDFTGGLCGSVGRGESGVAAACAGAAAFLRTKAAGQADTESVLTVKRLIREAEARSAAEACGLLPERLTFLDLRFYRTGKAVKAPLQEEDVQDVVDLLDRVRPDRVFLAGEESDPHGTHRVCSEAVYRALKRHSGSPEVWLYRGAWEEWPPHEIDRAVPLTPRQVEAKRLAVFRHQSQKDRAMFPGEDSREFWQRAEDRNRAAADRYAAMGLPRYVALETFVRGRSAGE